MKKKTQVQPKKKKKSLLSKEDRIALFVALGVVAAFLIAGLIVLFLHLGQTGDGNGESSTQSSGESVAKLDFSVGDFGYTITGTAAGNETVEVYNYTGNWSAIVIPETVVWGGTTYTVTTLSSYAIMTSNALTEHFTITIPKSIVDIGDMAIAYFSAPGTTILPTVYFGGSETDWNMIAMDSDMQEWLTEDTVIVFGE